MNTIKISEYRRSGAKVFTGRDNGMLARRNLCLDELEKKDVVNIQIPADTWSINPSFFGGMFEKSIQIFGDRFEEHYKFSYSDGENLNEALVQNIANNIDYVRRSMREVAN